MLVTRLRRPLDFYVSFFRWTVAWRQRHNASVFGATMLEWAPRNLQSIGLLHGDVELFAGLKAGGFPGVHHLGRRPHG